MPRNTFKDCSFKLSYAAKRAFFIEGLSKENRARFQELIDAGESAALFTSRYLCLGGQEYLPAPRAAKEAGVTSSNATLCSEWVYAVMVYLGAETDISKNSKSILSGLKHRADIRKHGTVSERRRNARFQRRAEEASKSEEILLAAGLSSWPKGLNVSTATQFVFLSACRADGRFGRLSDEQPLQAKYISRRFLSRSVANLDQIAKVHGVSKQCVAQHIERGFANLSKYES